MDLNSSQRGMNRMNTPSDCRLSELQALLGA